MMHVELVWIDNGADFSKNYFLRFGKIEERGLPA